ncbi:putative integral membrane protein [Ophiobolus disseminans]|uniref:Putative integral membrane protein n=1 Tax=Ophiobolus disseminans TaxID=1469910 RepID=A0A6A6ZRW3_9PLEO|nr:putative integral membrane protein [Ophiobolus disseminans]
MTSTIPASLPAFTPALKPPPGVTSSPDHPASLAHLATLTIAICIPLITTFFALRTYVRFWVKRLFTFEDVLCILLWAGTVAYCGLMRNTMSHGGGMHMWDITPSKAHEAAYWFNVCAIEYGVMIGLAKIAVLFLYRRVFSPHRWSAFDIVIVALITMIFIFYAVTSMVKIFECWPRNKIWDKSLPGKCVQMKWILNISGGFNTITDWIILLLPIHAVSRLQMDTLKKVLVVFAFTFGMCAPIFATVGFAVRIRNSGNKDVSWKQPEILLWGAGELASSNLIICFPEIGALFRQGAWRRQTPRKPGHSTLEGWSEGEPSKRVVPDPYMTKSLMTTTFNGDDGEYIELKDAGNDVRIACTQDKPQTSQEGVVVKNEFKIETHQIV